LDSGNFITKGGGMKKIIWIAFGWLALLMAAQATSFDCGKASSKIEKLICGDEKLSKLDEELNLAYKAALQDKNQSENIRLVQKQWLKERNGCKELDCLKTAYEARIRDLSGLQMVKESPPVDQSKLVGSNFPKSYATETTVQKLPLTYSLDQQVCSEAAAMLRQDKVCRPYDSSCLPISKDSSAEVNSININGTPTLTFKEIASNEYGYTRVFRTTAGDIEGYSIIYVEQFNGDNYPRTIETWKVNSQALNEVFELSPGPIPYEKGGNGKRKQKASHPKDTRATEFATLLRDSEKLSDDWSPIVEIKGGHYLTERKCSGEWAYGDYTCNRVIQLSIKKITASKSATIYCQFTNAINE
jgi:uncharacterized protein